MKIKHLWFAAWLLIGLTACQSLPPPHHQSWSLVGELSGHTSRASTRLRLVWKQEAERFSIRLRNPLGLLVARIDGDPQETVIQLAGKERLQGPNVEQIFLEEFGWSLPISDLSSWLLGNFRESRTVSVDEEGRPHTILAENWQLQVCGWQEREGADAMRPSCFYLSGAAGSLELVVRRWNGKPVQH